MKCRHVGVKINNGKVQNPFVKTKNATRKFSKYFLLTKLPSFYLDQYILCRTVGLFSYCSSSIRVIINFILSLEFVLRTGF